MTEKKDAGQRPDPERVAVLRNLPKDIVERLTKAEINALLFDEVWPDSLREKLKGYLVDPG
jgi:hypothetical protein